MPASPLLAAKLYPPPYRANLVARPRLTEKLDQGLRAGRKVTLVCAPAGFGKTTLVVEWLNHFQPSYGDDQEAPQPGAPLTGWLSLDLSDNSLPVFLRYLLAALRSIDPRIGQVTNEMLESGSLPPCEALLLPLLNDLHTFSTPFVLVLDDYHLIQDLAIHDAMTFLLERQPACMHTILTTRHDPLLPLARWRARGQLTDIRLGELRFNQSEAAGFFNQTMRLNLTAADISALEQRTEGWIAGLQMAAISMQQNDSNGAEQSSAGFIETFTGDDRFIMDYLVDEVLSRQPAEVQDFLLKTSILERFNASLCEAVTGCAQPAETQTATAHLAYLEGANLFLIPLDNRRQWYRYHHMFAELLSFRLTAARGSAYTASLQRLASRWCDENGFPEQAIHYALAAADWELGRRLILKHSPRLIRDGEVATLVRWIQAIPEDEIRRDPFLCRDYGYALTQSGLLTSGKVYFDLAEQGLAAEPAQLAGVLAFASMNALFRGDFPQQISMAQRSLHLLPPENAWLRGVASISLGMAMLHTGNPQSAEPAFHQALLSGQQSQSIRTCVNALDQLGRVCTLRGDFTQAEAYFRRAAQFQIDGRLSPGNDMSLLDLAMLKYEQNALDQAADFVAQGLEANRRTGSAEMLAYGYRLTARLQQLAGNAAAAKEHMQKALQLAADFDLSPLTLSLNAALQIEMALTDGDIRQAELAAPRVTNSLGVYPFIFYPETARAHLLLVLGQKEQALNLLKPVLAQVEQPGWEYARLQVRIIQAIGAATPAQALLWMKEALALGCAMRAVRAILDYGELARGLIEACEPRIDEHALRAYQRALLALLPAANVPGADSPSAGSPPTEQTLLAEPLSVREIEVLRLLADGLSNAEIAKRLYLSPNTLKAHTQNIYGKLDVHTRLQAVNLARELRII